MSVMINKKRYLWPGSSPSFAVWLATCQAFFFYPPAFPIRLIIYGSNGGEKRAEGGFG